MTTALDGASENLRCRRLEEAAAYRRLSDAALAAAAVLSDPDTTPADETRAHAAVNGRLESVKHARELLAACRLGMARAARPWSSYDSRVRA